jgi:hypothetical protein
MNPSRTHLHQAIAAGSHGTVVRGHYERHTLGRNKIQQ